jgi:DNA-3-methyladenine glycosylase II
MRNNDIAKNKGILLKIVQPYDFELSLRAVRSFSPNHVESVNNYRLAVNVAGVPCLAEIRARNAPGDQIEVSSQPAVDPAELKATAEWVLFNELDLAPFYRLTGRDSKLKPLTARLYGLKPMRPASLFEMAVIAITEQQISLAVAYRIRSRIWERFGQAVGGVWMAPEPAILAQASLSDLQSVGLSRQKAQYILDLASRVAEGSLNLDALKTMSDDEAREGIMQWHGFGRWSADYILVRGLARPDCVPVDDVAIRSVTGEFLGDGTRLSSAGVAAVLKPFAPFRGLLAFYLLAAHRLISS